MSMLLSPAEREVKLSSREEEAMVAGEAKDRNGILKTES
jgi:hypothetical protein